MTESSGIRWIRCDERVRTLDVAYAKKYRYERLDVEQTSSGEGKESASADNETRQMG